MVGDVQGMEGGGIGGRWFHLGGPRKSMGDTSSPALARGWGDGGLGPLSYYSLINILQNNTGGFFNEQMLD